MFNKILIRLRFYTKLFFGLPKSLILNLKYFGIQGFKFPIILTRRTKLLNIKGKVNFEGKIYFGRIRIGFNGVPMSTMKDWNVWNNNGLINFKGTAVFGTGTKIVVGKNGIINIGNKFAVTAKGELNCYHKITIENDVLFSWDILLMDTDAHPIRDENDIIINKDAEITIKNNCWIGSRVIILKNTFLNNNTIVATGSLVNKKFMETNVILAGIPAKIVKDKIVWKKETFKY